MTNHGELVLLGPSPMNIAVTPAHRAQTRAEIRARDVKERFAECGSPCLVANQWRKNVAVLQKQAASDADRFLTLSNVNAASDQTAAIKANELFFKRARQQHPAKCLEKAFMRRLDRLYGFAGALRSLKHETM